ncbi:wobble nucleotide-excising tRNase [Azospira oryzae]|uniref:Wobble nucleotide-excising tRNase n=1 Tax=Azospira oryzae TaxID=146939 RepID=A0ABY0IS99_9RHOO|nr:AAA family ATPase [Azospira oryzae]RZT89665.1 wobble nucleotide-excising tRNase [Azospira oryzae]
MITEIRMDAVASFKHATSLETDKKINLVYGLNGTGKSTISNFLYEPDAPDFISCSKVTADTTPVLVYNQNFIKDNFFIADNLKGIFSLAKENKEAEQKIAEGTKKQIELEQSLQSKRSDKEKINQAFLNQKQQAMEEVWDIKKTYAGGDRVLEYCLKGLMGKKETLFEHLLTIPKPTSEPTRGIQDLRKDVDALKGDDSNPLQLLSKIEFQAHHIESDKIFGTAILGNSDSEVALLIEQLGNADWVKQGVDFLPNEVSDAGVQCPFCQEMTITKKFVEGVRFYFDESYQKQLDTLISMQKKYQIAIESLPEISAFLDHPFAEKHKDTLSSKYKLLVTTIRNNAGYIGEKIRSPKAPVALTDTSSFAADFNLEISAINKAINEYNQKLQNRDASLTNLKGEFWLIMRWQYNQTVSRFEQDLQATNQKLKSLDIEIVKINSELGKIKEQITEAQKQTVNVEAAVDAINAGLLDLGIADFSVKKHSNSLYRVVRAGGDKDAFQSLSEGEKMMISFLYFCELCKGKSSVDDTHTQRIVVIDDPISSLSHIFVFNVGRLIRTVFFNDERFCQVIVLTHSLYFFYELTETNHDRRKENQKLFRLTKTSSGSVIQEMKYEEIQNDYQAYWSVINDHSQPPALIANCMRNIIEYFFNFVRKKDLNNVFQMPELQDAKYQAFCRYINRESHSLGQNIIDMKEFDYSTFKDGLRLIFEQTGYPDHYKAMSKL